MTTESDHDKMIFAVRTLLDKRQDGEAIQLDWNAFEAASALKEPELKDIHMRLCPNYSYDLIKKELRSTVQKKRAELLSLAKDKITVRVLKECQQMNLIIAHQIVSSKDLLNKWLRETSGKQSDREFRTFTEDTFRENARWQDDMAHELMDLFGIEYDRKTVNKHSNSKGNGFLEKICTKALQNVRQDLRGVRDRARTGNAAPRIKRAKDQCYDNDGKYQRKKHKVSL
jgi:hypothetical protein